MAFDIVDLINNPDVYNYALPFLLVFTLTFSILQKIKLLGKDEEDIRKYNAIVAFVLGFLVVRNQELIGMLHRFLPNISFFIVVILLTLVMIGLFLPNEYKGITGGLLNFMILVSVGLVFWALAAENLGFRVPYWLENWYYNFFTDGNWIFLVILLVVIWFMFGSKKDNLIKDMYFSLGPGFTGGKKP